MNNLNVNFLYILSFFTAALGLISLAVFVSYLKLVKRVLALRDENERLVKQSGEKAGNDLAKATDEARRIIENANNKAQEMITTSQVFNEQNKAKIETMLVAATNEEMKEYKKVLEQTGKVSIDSVQKMSHDVREQITPELGKIKEMIENEIKGASEETKAAISSAYTIVEKEIDDYKKQMYSEVDKLTLSVVKDLSKKVLGKAISTKEQEEMVISALEEAKKQRII